MMELKVIAHIRTDFGSKFGVPRQSGLVEDLLGEIVFEKEFRQPEALIGMEEYSHIWLLWEFSENKREHWSATVYPPRLGGRQKRGVFATRSPFRPNPIGLSCVRLRELIHHPDGSYSLLVEGADLMDGTPIYDIKPYLPYADCITAAKGGFGQEHRGDSIFVDFPEHLLQRLPEDKRKSALKVLEQDPRAAYQKQPDSIYGMEFAGFDIRFRQIQEGLQVMDVIKLSREFKKIK